MKETKLAPESRDWKMEDVDVDPRFVACRKECILVFCMYFVHMALLTLDCIYGSNVSNWKYFAGLPLHICFLILEIAAFIGLIILVVSKVFVDMDMSPIGKIIEKDKK